MRVILLIQNLQIQFSELLSNVLFGTTPRVRRRGLLPFPFIQIPASFHLSLHIIRQAVEEVYACAGLQLIYADGVVFYVCVLIVFMLSPEGDGVILIVFVQSQDCHPEVTWNGDGDIPVMVYFSYLGFGQERVGYACSWDGCSSLGDI